MCNKSMTMRTIDLTKPLPYVKECYTSCLTLLNKCVPTMLNIDKVRQELNK